MFSNDWLRIPSPHNGQIDVRINNGEPEVFVDGYDQSTPYIRAMWSGAFDRFPTNTIIDKALILGLGAGTVLREIGDRFPTCASTVIEHDPVMIDLFRRHWKGQPPSIIEGDAFTNLPNIVGPFDLIVVDLFRGQQCAPQLADPQVIEQLASLLSPSGLCLLNVFKNFELLPRFAESMVQLDEWRYKYNLLGLFTGQSDR